MKKYVKLEKTSVYSLVIKKRYIEIFSEYNLSSLLKLCPTHLPKYLYAKVLNK